MNKFIVIEGMDGSGKSSVLDYLKKNCEQDKFAFVNDPGGTKIGDKIRTILLDSKNTNMNPVSELMLFVASRAQLVNEVIKPTLETKHVISDRFTLSTLVYQYGVKHLGDLNAVVEFGLKDFKPDLILLLDVEPAISFKRISERNLDRMENKGNDYLTGVRNRYLKYAKSMKNVQIIDASRPFGMVATDIYQRILNLAFYS